MTLEDPTLIFNSINQASASVSTNWVNFRLSKSLLNSFAILWSKRVGYPFEIGNGTNRLFTSSENSEVICDSDLALAICTYPLHALLWQYKKCIIDIVNANKIPNFKDDFSSKPKGGMPPNWHLYENAIDQSAHNADEKKKLKIFLTNPEKFHGIKGISRDDFDTPALCYSIDKRVDRFSICSQIASCVTKEFHRNLLDYIEGNYSDSVVAVRTSSFFIIPPLLQSLVTKRFVILTGASGTGKTQLAEGLARHYAEGDASRFAVVAVGADWTDNRHVLGYVNHLRQAIFEEAEKPIFQSTPVLDLLLRAAHDNENKPYFLVLDEMNLSHVERYFADFLSAMERREGTLQLHSNQGSLPRSENDTLGIPQEIPFPRNLFVIGTVNVDETTYMFSPKVLDRANVIEFRMGENDLGNFLMGDGSPPDYGTATAQEAQDFFLLASSDALDDLPASVKTASADHLRKIFMLMESCRFEFGYRAAKEVMRFLKICRHLAEDKTAWDGGAWLSDMDTQILQKLMPRLHGGKARMVPLLTDLGYLCHGSEKPTGARLDSLESLQGTAKFPRSFEKIRAMAKVLIEEQFVSFIC